MGTMEIHGRGFCDSGHWPVPPPLTRQPNIAGSVEGEAAGLALLTGTDGRDARLARFGKGGAT